MIGDYLITRKSKQKTDVQAKMEIKKRGKIIIWGRETNQSAYVDFLTFAQKWKQVVLCIIYSSTIFFKIP